jgi:hypothetical protein
MVLHVVSSAADKTAVPLAEHTHGYAEVGHVHSGDTGWDQLALTNGWSNYSSSYPVQWRRVGGVVYLRGEVSKPPLDIGTSQTSDRIATLPAGARPGRWRVFTVVGYSMRNPNDFGWKPWIVSDNGTRVDVQETGDVVGVNLNQRFSPSTVTTARIYLDDIAFIAEN